MILLSFHYLSSLIAIIMTKANQSHIISNTIPQNEYSEYMVFVGVIIAIVDHPMTIPDLNWYHNWFPTHQVPWRSYDLKTDH